MQCHRARANEICVLCMHATPRDGTPVARRSGSYQNLPICARAAPTCAGRKSRAPTLIFSNYSEKVSPRTRSDFRPHIRPNDATADLRISAHACAPFTLAGSSGAAPNPQGPLSGVVNLQAPLRIRHNLDSCAESCHTARIDVAAQKQSEPDRMPRAHDSPPRTRN